MGYQREDLKLCENVSQRFHFFKAVRPDDNCTLKSEEGLVHDRNLVYPIFRGQEGIRDIRTCVKHEINSLIHRNTEIKVRLKLTFKLQWLQPLESSNHEISNNR